MFAADTINVKCGYSLLFILTTVNITTLPQKNKLYPHCNVYYICRKQKSVKGQSHKNSMSTTVNINSSAPYLKYYCCAYKIILYDRYSL